MPPSPLEPGELRRVTFRRSHTLHSSEEGLGILRFVFAKNQSGRVSLDLVARLHDGDALIQEWVEETIPAAWTMRQHQLSQEPSTWDDLRVDLTRQGQTTALESDLRRVLVSLVEMELRAVRISGAADLPSAVAGRVGPQPADIPLPLGIGTPSVHAPAQNSPVLRISANNLYITWTEPHQWVAWDEWPAMAASWRFQREAGPTGEEYHGTGSFIHWVAQTIAIAPG
jgi:hypothetical protein